MHDPDAHREELVDYVLGEIDADARRGFEAHLEECPGCVAELRELTGIARRLDAIAPAVAPPPSLRTGIIAAVARDSEGDRLAEAAVGNGAGPYAQRPAIPTPPAPPEPPAPPARRPLNRLRLGFAAGLAAAAAAVALILIPGGGSGAPVEIDATMTGDGSAEIVVSRLGSGREIAFESTSLAILPSTELYELWFVGPGDSAEAPNRISAGTFHPDEAGDTDVILHAAVDPELYPLIEVTAEPGGGDPEVEGPVVLEFDARTSVDERQP